MAITKISDITAIDLANRLKVDTTDDNLDELNLLLLVAKNYISNYTGLPISTEGTEPTIDDYPDMIVALMVLVQYMYDVGIEDAPMNNCVKSILDMHSVNLL